MDIAAVGHRSVGAHYPDVRHAERLGKVDISLGFRNRFFLFGIHRKRRTRRKHSDAKPETFQFFFGFFNVFGLKLFDVRRVDFAADTTHFKAVVAKIGRGGYHFVIRPVRASDCRKSKFHL